LSSHPVKKTASRGKDRPVPTKTARPRTLPPEQRRRQIVDAVLRVVSEHGVPDTTTARIAKAAGVAEGTLYVHFASRDEMLIAALDEIFMQMLGLIDASTTADPLERLREIGRRHTELMRTERAGFAYSWMEFVAAGPQVGLREAIAETQKRAFRALRGIVEEGKAGGSIRGDLDSDRLVWEWLTVMWSENMAILMGLNEILDAGHSAALLDLILDHAAARRAD
jgi:AcrR family transcriptional regulator